jgi:hypothetical protein
MSGTDSAAATPAATVTWCGECFGEIHRRDDLMDVRGDRRKGHDAFPIVGRHQHGDEGLTQDALGCRSKEHLPDAAPAVRAHDDELGADFTRDAQDLGCRLARRHAVVNRPGAVPHSREGLAAEPAQLVLAFLCERRHAARCRGHFAEERVVDADDGQSGAEVVGNGGRITDRAP